VRALSNTPDAILVKLLRVMRTGTIADLEAAVKEAGGDDAVAKATGSTSKNLTRTLRVLLLSTLAYKHLGRPLTFEEVAKELGLDLGGMDEDESAELVESWVLEAVQMGVLDARVDEVGATVRVTRATPRAVDAEVCASATKTLGAMKAAVEVLGETIDGGSGAAQTSASGI